MSNHLNDRFSHCYAWKSLPGGSLSQTGGQVFEKRSVLRRHFPR